MSFKDIFAVATSETGSAHVLDFAEQLAQQQQGKISTWVVNWQPSLPLNNEVWVSDPWWGDLLTEAQRKVEAEAVGIRARLDRSVGPASTESALLEFGAARPVIGMRARHADVTIVSRPPASNGDSDQTILEAALFYSGRPVLIVPPGWTKRPIGKSVLVCWKPTREAARALGDARPFLETASQVSIVTVDARPSESADGSSPGADVAAHLARCGCKADVFNLDSKGRTESDAILDQARAVNADLIVMGGFGHSRLSEIVFGGVTRDVLKTAALPILMSH